MIIIKNITNKNSRNIKVTASYMADIKKHGSKVDFSGSLNLAATIRKDQINEFELAVDLLSTLSTQAASHQIISYPLGLIPTQKQVERDIKILLSKYGMNDQPVLYDTHKNTEHYHVHMLLCRVSQEPDSKGRYLIMDNGIVKKTERKRNLTRTCFASCRQAAIDEIGELYGLERPKNLRCTKDGKLLPRVTAKDSHAKGTLAEECKTGKKSRQRQIAENALPIFLQSKSWDELKSRLANIGLQFKLVLKKGKIVGSNIIGKDNIHVACSRIGTNSDYGYFKLLTRFGTAQEDKDYNINTFAYTNEITHEQAKKQLLPIFNAAKNWQTLIADISDQNMSLQRSGGGIIVTYNNNKDRIKCSDIHSQYSLSKIEKRIGTCLLPKVMPSISQIEASSALKPINQTSLSPQMRPYHAPNDNKIPTTESIAVPFGGNSDEQHKPRPKEIKSSRSITNSDSIPNKPKKYNSEQPRNANSNIIATQDPDRPIGNKEVLAEESESVAPYVPFSPTN